MPLSLAVTGADKDQLVVSLAALILADCGSDITAESLDAIVSSSGNKIPSYYSALFATFIGKAGGVDKYMAGPSSGGGGGSAPAAAAGGAAAPAAVAKVAAPVEEEVDALDGGMDMFGGGGAKTGDY